MEKKMENEMETGGKWGFRVKLCYHIFSCPVGRELSCNLSSFSIFVVF